MNSDILPTLGEVALGGITDADIIVALILGNSMDQAGGGVDIAVKDIHDGISRFLSEQRTVQDSSHVIVINPLFHQSGPNSINDDNSIVAIVCNLNDHTVLI